MLRCIVGFVVLLTFNAIETSACAEGGDYSKQELAPKGELVKGLKPVHGYWVNWEDVFFYSGDTAAFNQFAEMYGKATALKLKIVIHPGPKGARSPWDMADRDIPVEWSYYVWNTGLPDPKNPAPSRIDVWVGGHIKLNDLRIPANVEVVSGGEIERFVAERQKPMK